MTRALIVIDVQESFRTLPSWAVVSDPRIADKVDRLLTVARRGGDLVVWVLHTAPGSGNPFDPALGQVRIFDELGRRDGEPVVHKTSHNAFTTTNLQQLLTARGVDEVVVCGIRTEQCVETTARVASDLGYRVLFVTDATATHPIAHPSAQGETLESADVAATLPDPRTLTAEEVIRRTEYALTGRFATITTVAEIEGVATARAEAVHTVADA